MIATSAATPNGAGFDGVEMVGKVSSRPLIDATMIISWLFLSFASGRLLFGPSRDYYEYLGYYESIPVTFSVLDTRFEPGFHAVAWLFRNWFQADLSTLIIVLAMASLAVKFLLFRKYLQYPLLAVLFYTVLFFPIHEYTQYRVGISLAFGYWAIHLLLDRRFVWAVVLFALSFSFHYSSILLLIVGFGGLFVRGRWAVAVVVAAAVIGATLIEPLRFMLEDLFGALNPLSGSYLDNKAMIEGVSLTSVNNLLLIAAVACYIAAGYYSRGRYHAVFLTMTIASLVPIALLPEAPVIAQRSKEVLFVAVIFLACRSRLRAPDLPGLAFVAAMTGLLGYLWVAGGIIFT